MPTHVWSSTNWTLTADAVGNTYTFELAALNFDNGVTNPGPTSSWLDTIALTFCTASVSIAFLPQALWDAGANTAVAAWRATLPEYPWSNPWSRDYPWVFVATATAPGATPQKIYLCTGAYSGYPNPTSPRTWLGPTEWILAGSFAINNVECRGRTGWHPPNDRAAIRNWTDRLVQYLLFSNAQTTVTATIGSATATGDFNFGHDHDPDGGDVTGSVALGGEVGAITLYNTYTNAYATNTSYAEVRDPKCGNVAADLHLENCLAWSTNGTDWTFRTTDPGSSTWKLFSSGGDILMHRIGSSPANAIGQARCQVVGPVGWNADAARFAPDLTFALPAGWRFDGGLSRCVSLTPAGAPVYETVWLTAGLSQWYTATWWYWPTDISNRIKVGELYFRFLDLGCEVDGAWLSTNHEDPQAGECNQRRGMVVLPSIQAALSTTTPYWAGALTVDWAEASVDIPPGEAGRPSLWTAGTGGTVNGGDNSLWTIGASGGAITRTLKRRWPYRFDWVASHAGGWFNTDLAIWNKANRILDVDDEPTAVAAVPVEDVFNYDNSSWLRATFSAWPAAAELAEVTLTLGYSLVSISDPWYTGAGVRAQNWSYTRTQHTVTITGTLTAAGIVDFDLAQLPRSNTVNLQRVDTLAWAFPAFAGDYNLADLRLRVDPEEGATDATYLQAGIAPWDFLGDFTGFGGTADGVACLNIDDGAAQYRGAQRGMAQTQFLQHDPDSEATGDPTYAKVISRLHDELDYQEQLDPTYGTAAVAAATIDADGYALGGLFCWDNARGTGDSLTGYAGLAVKKFVAAPYGTPFVGIRINCFWGPQGRAHGIALANGVRVRGNGTSADDSSGERAVQRRVAGSSDAWVAAGSCSPNGFGRWRTPPLLESYYEYRLRTTALTPISAREYTPLDVSWGSVRNPHLQRAIGGLIFRVFQNGAGATADIAGDRTDAGPPGTWTPFAAKPLSGAYKNPFIVVEDDGALLVSATNTVTGNMDFARSRDRGTAWEAVV